MSLEDRRRETTESVLTGEKDRLNKARQNLEDGIATKAERAYLKSYLKSAYKQSGDLAKDNFTQAEKRLLKLDIADRAKDKLNQGKKLTRKEKNRLKKDVRRRNEFARATKSLTEARDKFENTFEESVQAGILSRRGGLSKAEQAREMRRIYGSQSVFSRLSTQTWINLFFLLSVVVFILGVYFRFKKSS